jgi:hypothetical protein
MPEAGIHMHLDTPFVLQPASWTLLRLAAQQQQMAVAHCRQAPLQAPR